MDYLKANNTDEFSFERAVIGQKWKFRQPCIDYNNCKNSKPKKNVSDNDPTNQLCT